ncbi:MAG: AlpA family phage regulatory protein [Rudaea sp.]
MSIDTPAGCARRYDARARRAELAVNASAVLSAGGLLRQPELLALIPLSASTLWAHIRAGEFPPPVKIGKRAVAWRATAIRDYIAHLGNP